MPRARPFSLYAASGQRKYLNSAERVRFLAAAQTAEPMARTLCLALAYLGCRLSEVLALRSSHLQQEAGLVAIRSLKKRRLFLMREVPAPALLFDELAAVHDLACPDALLWPWSRTTAWRLVKGVMQVAGIGHLAATPKGLRHGFGVHAVLSGVPLNLIQKWLGHTDIATTAIYTDVLGPEERAIASRMWPVDTCGATHAASLRE